MTTTSEQLAKWREDAELAFPEILKKNYPYLDTALRTKGAPFKYIQFATESVWLAFEAGYLRRCQETEQAIKDARKQALEEARDLFSESFAMLSSNVVREIIGGLLND